MTVYNLTQRKKDREAGIYKSLSDYEEGKKKTSGEQKDETAPEEKKTFSGMVKKEREGAFSSGNAGKAILEAYRAWKEAEAESLKPKYISTGEARFSEANLKLLEASEKTETEESKKAAELGMTLAEYRKLQRERTPSFGEALGANIMAGVGAFNEGLSQTIDFFLPDFLTPEPVQNTLNEYKTTYGRRFVNYADKINQQAGGGWNEGGGKLVQEAVRMVPNMVLAAASGGGSEVVSLAGAGASASFATQTATAARNLIKNPSFWGSAFQTVGSTYERAKADGASELEAMATALINGFLSSGIEVGSGVEQYIARGGNARSWVKQTLEEGGEEVLQGLVENLTKKAVYDKNKAWISAKDENAVINPSRMVQEASGGIILGGLMGAPFATINQEVDVKAENIEASDEKLAVFGDIDNVIANGEYVGSGRYEQKGKQKDTIRFDYFETPVTINGKEYIATFDVEVFPNTNNYRTHKIIEKIDLVPRSNADADPVPAANERVPTSRAIGMESSLSNNSIPQNAENSNRNMKENFGEAEFSDGRSQRELYREAVSQRGSEARAARKVMGILSARYGAKFRLYEGDARKRGFFDPKAGEIYINTNAEAPLVDAVSHEFMHYFKEIDQGGYQLLSQYIESEWNLRKFNQYKNELLSAYDELGIDYSNLSQEELYDMVREEAICDLFSEVMRDPETIARIAKSNRSVAEKIVEFLERIIREIQEMLSSLGLVADPEVRALVKNFESVKALYQEVVSQSNGEFSSAAGNGGPVKYLYAGEKAAQKDESALNKAKQMRKDGATNLETWEETGWFVGADGRWRFEIDDSQMEVDFDGATEAWIEECIPRLKQELPEMTEEELRRERQEDREGAVLKLGNLVKHPTLFRHYPDLAEVKVSSKDYIDALGQYDEKRDEIKLRRENPHKRETLIHEVQHAVQAREGFTQGSNPDMWDGTPQEKYEKYTRTAGELEAEEAKYRRKFNKEERKRNLPMTMFNLGDYILFAEDAPNRSEDEFAGEVDADEIQISENGVKFSAKRLNNDSQSDIIEADGYADSLDKAVDTFRVKKTKMKTFPPYNKSQSDANERAARWAHGDDIATGTKKLASYHGRWYIIEKYDSAEMGYYIVGSVDSKIINQFVNEVKKHAGGTKNQRVQRSSNRFAGIDAKRNWAGGNGRSAGDDATQYNREDGRVQQLGENKAGEWRVQGDATTSNEYDGENRQGISGIGFSEITSDSDGIKHSVVRKPRVQTAEEAGDEIDAIWLPSREYAMVSRAVMAKNAGLTDNELKAFDYVYAADEFYVYENHSVGNFTVINKLDIVADFERIDVLKGLVEDGIYTNTDRERLNRLIDDVRSRERSNTGNHVRAENERTTVDDDRVFSGQQGGNAVGYSSGTSKDNPAEGIKHSVMRKPRVRTAEEALSAYKETGDEGVLPNPSWIGQFRRDAKNRAEYFAGQISGTEFDLTYHAKTEEERARLTEILENMRLKHQDALKTLQVAEEIQAVADAVGINRNLHLAEIVDELHDADKGVLKAKNGNYRFNDVFRNFKRVFGKYYETHAKPMLDAFSEAKGDWARDMVGRRADLRIEVVKKLGIKKGSKESKAIQWIGEGERNIDWKRDKELLMAQGVTQKSGLKPGMRLVYTEAMLEGEFGKERAAQIKKAAEWFRAQYDELIDEINRVRAQIYPGQADKLIPKRKDYFRHFQEISEGLSGLRTIFNMENNISPDLVGISEYTKPKTKWASIVQHRDGKVTDEGAVEGYLDYLPQAMRAIHIDPYIEQFRGLARDLAELKSDTGDVSLNGFIKYLGDYSAHLAGKSSAFDRAIIDTFGSGGRSLVRGLSWFNNRTKANAILGNLGSVAKQVMNLPNGLVLLENPANLIGGILDTAAGCEVFGLREGNELQKRYKKSDFLTERLEVEKAQRKLEKNGLGKGLSILLGAADEFGARTIWNAAYREGLSIEVKKEGGKTSDATEAQKKAAARYADDLTRSAVAGRGIGEVPLAYQSQMGKLALPFQIEVSNTWNVYRDIVTGRRKGGGLEHAASRAWRLALGYLATWALSAALEELTGSKGAFDPIGDIVDGFLQGFSETEGEDVWSGIGTGALRSAQNVGGDFIGSRPFGWFFGTVLSWIDEDWDETFFNGNVFASQGANIPALQSAMKAGKKIMDGDNIGGTAEFASSFLTPYGGKQVEKSLRGLGDVARGGNYQNNIFKEFSTGERGEQYYEIEQSPGKYLQAALFGPSALSENKEYWENKRLESAQKEKAKRLLTEKERTFRNEYDKAHSDGEVRKLYQEARDFSVYPFEEVRQTRTFTENGEERSFVLSEAEQKKYQELQNQKMQELYEAIFAMSKYQDASAAEKTEMLSDARSEAKSIISSFIKADYLTKEFRKEYDKVHPAGEVQRLYQETNDSSVYPYAEVGAERKFTKDKKEYSFKLSDSQVKRYQQMQNRLMEKEYEKLFQTAEYRKAKTDKKLEMLKEVKSKVKREVSLQIKEDYLKGRK